MELYGDLHIVNHLFMHQFRGSKPYFMPNIFFEEITFFNLLISEFSELKKNTSVKVLKRGEIYK